ncbi:MAG TPA: outer membrane beta-barrel protein [Gemmatimonadaceae bacterium]|jgi:hypothetical protein
MMKKLFSGLAAAALILGASTLSAQSTNTVQIGIAAGAAIPVGDFADLFNTGYNGTVFVGIKPLTSPVGIRVDGMYNKFLGRDDIAVNQPDANIIGGTANLVYSLPGVGIRPYLIGGAGYYGLKLDTPGAERTGKFGVNGGVGAAFALSGFNTFLEARFHHVDTEGGSTQFIPVIFGLSF